MNKSVFISLILGIVISTYAFYLAFQHVSGAELIDYLSQVNLIWLIPAVLVSQFTFVLRAMRWRLLLSQAGKISFWESFHPLMIGFMMNCVAPGRVGEVVRPVVLYKITKVPIPAGFAALVAERLLDLLFLLMLLLLTLHVVEIDMNLKIGFHGYQLDGETLMQIARGMSQLALLLMLSLVLLIPDKIRLRITQLMMMSPSILFFLSRSVRERIKQKICVPTAGLIDNFALGLSLIKHPAKLSICLIYTVLIWTIQVLAYYLVMLGCPGLSLTFLQMTVYLVIICMFIMLPSVPGFWGLWEAGGVFALALFGVPAAQAAGFTLTNHIIQVFPVIAIGFGSMMRLGFTFKQISSRVKKRV